MKEVECITYAETNYFSRLILDYLAGEPKLQPFINDFPSLESFAPQIERKANFTADQRNVLVQALKEQYKRDGIHLEPNLIERIDLLRDSNTFTVCTGHQLSILTGPLYFIYKIISTINLAERLEDAYPNQKFQPVFWMASEDHDFEEISFINLFGGKLSWKNDRAGAVGEMPNYGMGKVIDELEEHLGEGQQSGEIIALFRAAYHEHDNLAAATRFLVHELFKQYNLLIIDGNDPLLKRSMIHYFKEDLTGKAMQEALAKQSEELKGDYFAQVFPREINLFYLGQNSRERIEKRAGKYYVLNTDIVFEESELLLELESHPEKFSPNVALRPLYQEVILPNLAYIGGGGEIAYWLQLKGMFDYCEVPFPLPMVRNSVLFVEQKWQNRLADLKLEVRDLFQGLHQLKQGFLGNNFPEDMELKAFDTKIEDLFNELERIAKLTDQSMMGAVQAQKQKQLKGIANLRKKLLRAEKRRHHSDMEKIERIFYALFPKGGLQERHDNLAYYYAAYGSAFIQQLKDSLDPLDFSFSIIKA